MVTNDRVRAEDILPVHSRIAGGPILAGAVLALASYLLLTLLGSALGLSISGRVSDRGMAIGAVVWAIAVTIWSLFVGGFVASMFTTGENKYEGAVYGLIVWAIVLAMIVMTLAAGVRAGFGTMMSVATTAGNVAGPSGNWEEAARRNGASDADIERTRGNIAAAPQSIRDAVNDPANRQAIEDNATRAAWYSVLGTALSMLAAAAGGYVGSGPRFRLMTVISTRTPVGRDVNDATFARA